MTAIKRIGILFGWIAGCICLSALCATAGQSDWLTDFDQAKKEAAEKKRPILADFTGSDWCGWCIKLDQEVFSTKEFLDFAKKHLILFQADFPSRKKLPAATMKQNEELAQTYGIEGFPTIVLLDAGGKVLARTGYQSGGAKAYVEHLKELLERR
ncbi:MAG: thioredoxin family protein [Lentisphaerae bacterium]|nr:thioredoxin family protein [Lentisphaerota bacterium]